MQDFIMDRLKMIGLANCIPEKGTLMKINKFGLYFNGFISKNRLKIYTEKYKSENI
jgi:hypothetical protein